MLFTFISPCLNCGWLENQRYNKVEVEEMVKDDARCLMKIHL